MADYSALVKGFQGGADFAQRFRANKQFETARDQALERGEYDLQSQRAFRKTQNPDAAGVLGEDYAAQNTDWGGALEDPFAFKMFDWIKKKLGKKGKKQKALDLGGDSEFASSNPGDSGGDASAEDSGEAQTYPYDPGYADGGEIADAMENARGTSQAFASQASAVPQTTVQAGGSRPMPSVTGVVDTGQGYADGGAVSEEEKIRERAARNRARNPGTVERATETVRGADRTARAASGGGRRALDVADDAVGKFTGRAAKDAGLLRKAGAGAKRLGTAGALAGTAITTATTPTEDYRERFGLETNDPSLLGDIGVRALGAASDLGSILTFGAADRLYRDKQRQAAETAAPQEQAIPVDQGASFPQDDGGGGQRMALDTTTIRARPMGGGQSRTNQPDVVDFGAIDIDPKEVPDMKTDDWKRYRAQVIAAAQKSGNPEAVSRANDMVTEMQQKGFLNYGMQGLALQQAGNVRGAMAAYRAAFQYFPNGNDVEFGTSTNKRTGRKQIIGFGLDEKTGKVVPGTELIMDPERVGVLLENFKNPQAFRAWTKDWRDFNEGQKRYEEVTKPLAQAQADSLANNSEARILAAENQALRAGAAGGAGGAANLRNAERVFRERLSMMALEDDTQSDYLASVMSQIKVANPGVPDNTIMQVGTQSVRDGTLEQRLQKMGIGRAPAQRQALPMAGGGEDEMPPGVDPEAWNDPEVAQLPYDERVAVSTPAR